MNQEAMSCEEIRELIDGMSPGELREQFGDTNLGKHLQGCAECRTYYEKSVALSAALDRWNVPSPRKNIQAGVMTAIARLEREQRRTQSLGGFFEQLATLVGYRLRVPAAAVLGLLLLLAVSVTLNIVHLSRTGKADGSRLVRVQQPGSGIPALGSPAETTPAPLIVTEQELTVFQGTLPGIDRWKRGAVSAPVVVILGIPPWLYPQPAARLPESRFISDSESREDKI